MALALLLLAATGVSAEVPVRFDPPWPRLGDLVIIYAHAPDEAVREAPIEVFGYATVLGRASQDALRGVLAVPMDLAPMPYVARIHFADRTVEVELSVRDRSWDSSELRVNKRFTERPNRALERRRELESERWEAMWTPAPTRPKFIGPIARPLPGEVTAVFGTARMFNGKVAGRHYGLDLDAKVGDDVVAAQAGVAVMSEDRDVAGGTIVLDHGGGLFTAYFHLSERIVARDERVEAGELIGAAGRTGRVTGPHLHLAVLVRQEELRPEGRRVRGLYVDPAQFLELRFEGELSRIDGGEGTKRSPGARAR